MNYESLLRILADIPKRATRVRSPASGALLWVYCKYCYRNWYTEDDPAPGVLKSNVREMPVTGHSDDCVYGRAQKAIAELPQKVRDGDRKLDL